MSRHQYKASLRLNLDETKVNLIPVIDASSNSSSREQEVIHLVDEILRLASKRGRVGNNPRELIDEAA